MASSYSSELASGDREASNSSGFLIRADSASGPLPRLVPPAQPSAAVRDGSMSRVTRRNDGCSGRDAMLTAVRRGRGLPALARRVRPSPLHRTFRAGSGRPARPCRPAGGKGHFRSVDRPPRTEYAGDGSTASERQPNVTAIVARHHCYRAAARAACPVLLRHGLDPAEQSPAEPISFGEAGPATAH